MPGFYFNDQFNQHVFFEHHYVPSTVLGTRNAVVNESCKVLVFIHSEFASC
jgi:hypothetical protein